MEVGQGGAQRAVQNTNKQRSEAYFCKRLRIWGADADKPFCVQRDSTWEILNIRSGPSIPLFSDTTELQNQHLGSLQAEAKLFMTLSVSQK